MVGGSMPMKCPFILHVPLLRQIKQAMQPAATSGMQYSVAYILLFSLYIYGRVINTCNTVLCSSIILLLPHVSSCVFQIQISKNPEQNNSPLSGGVTSLCCINIAFSLLYMHIRG